MQFPSDAPREFTDMVTAADAILLKIGAAVGETEKARIKKLLACVEPLLDQSSTTEALALACTIILSLNYSMVKAEQN